MTTVAVSMMKDEADLAAFTIRAMLRQVDAVIVADNMSSDGTTGILHQVAAQAEDVGQTVLVVEDTEAGYFQSAKMTALAHQAHELFDADWVIPFDADELWYSPFGRIADLLDAEPGEVNLVPARMFDHVATGADLPGQQDPFARLVWRRPMEGVLPKVAVRWHEDLTIHQGNHGADFGVLEVVPAQPFLVIRHFPYRTAEQFVRKARNGKAAYDATDLPDSAGAHWRRYGEFAEQDEQVCAAIFMEHFHDEDPTASGLVYDPAYESIAAGLKESEGS